MTPNLFTAIGAGALLVVMSAAGPAAAQKQGGVLKMYTPDSPASMSILEEGTVFAQGPMMGVFNNLVLYDQQIAQSSLWAGRAPFSCCSLPATACAGSRRVGLDAPHPSRAGRVTNR